MMQEGEEEEEAEKEDTNNNCVRVCVCVRSWHEVKQMYSSEDQNQR
jgi:hypothetical protein